MNNNKVVVFWPDKRLKELSLIYAKSPTAFSSELKREIIDIANVSGRQKVAAAMAIHPATIAKWKKKLPPPLATKKTAATPKPQAPVVVGATDRQHVATSLPYLAILLPLEFYLAFKCHQLATQVFIAGNIEAIAMACLTELVPIMLCYVKVTTIMSFLEKLVASGCLAATFIFSVYCVAGVEVNSIVDQISDTNKTQQIKSNLENRISQTVKDIDFYKNATRQDGKGRGWPYRVKSLQELKVSLQLKLESMQTKMTKNKSLLWLNLLMVLILRLSWQCASLIISSRLFKIWRTNG